MLCGYVPSERKAHFELAKEFFLSWWNISTYSSRPSPLFLALVVRLTGVVPGGSASHHLAWPQCGCAAAGLPDAEIFSLQFDLSMTALSILGIAAEI